MRRADRLFQIVQLLRGGRLVTAAQLAEKLEVTPRTIYRDVADLMSTGVPIEGEAGVGYIMRDGYDLPPLMFTEAEIVALVAGARMMQVWGGAAMAEGATEAIVKIEAVLPERLRQRVNAVGVNAHDMNDLSLEVRQLIDQIERVSYEKRRLTITYRDESGSATTRTVRPLGLWYWGKVWTMVCWCELRAGFRMFRIDRIADITEDERFKDEAGKTLRDFYASDDRRPLMVSQPQSN
ncbi:helix-turn-helix transcriptional regulator [Marivivens donghaensis]|uniref:helix-turn-helix transcriptional regulator n=1 Tax=Marivivens donghaensis TaxID=1699413 RepID=UPI00201EBC40|nr:YafY family protein [Marivivens donghaensis]MCL7408303.1 YafY family transcriptional regulator [Marivivens donghaensis]MDN3704926.1 YafY family protein [Marivivens donghaensis]